MQTTDCSRRGGVRRCCLASLLTLPLLAKDSRVFCSGLCLVDPFLVRSAQCCESSQAFLNRSDLYCDRSVNTQETINYVQKTVVRLIIWTSVLSSFCNSMNGITGTYKFSTRDEFRNYMLHVIVEIIYRRS